MVHCIFHANTKPLSVPYWKEAHAAMGRSKGEELCTDRKEKKLSAYWKMKIHSWWFEEKRKFAIKINKKTSLLL
jgi:hypothetical protein